MFPLPTVLLLGGRDIQYARRIRVVLCSVGTLSLFSPGEKYFTYISINSCAFHKVFKDPIFTKANVSHKCHHGREAKANELRLMFRYFTTVNVCMCDI